MSAEGHEAGAAFDYGRMAVALEIVTAIRTLEDPVLGEGAVLNSVARWEVIGSLEGLLANMGVATRAYDVYETLAEWRKTRLVPASPAGVSPQVDGQLRSSQQLSLEDTLPESFAEQEEPPTSAA
jgi:hypothetical protein